MNGRIALKDGKVTGEQAGRVLTRDAHMPSRPLSHGAGRLSVNGAVRRAALLDRRSLGEGGSGPPVAGLKGPRYIDRVVVDLTQAANAPRAKGTIRITDATAGEVLEATEIGVLQTTKNWASVTAMLRAQRSGDVRAATIVVEHSDPFVEKRPRTVTIDTDSRPRITGVLQ